MNKSEKNVIIKDSDEKSTEIKKENKKALVRFVPILIGAALGGGLFGALSTTGGMQDFAGKAADIFDNFAFMAAPYLVILTEVLSIAFALIYYRKACRDYESYVQMAAHESEDTEDILDEIYRRTDRKLSIGLIAINIGTILSFMFFGICICNLKGMLDSGSFAVPMTATGVFVVGMLAEIKIQQVIVDLTKKMNPKMVGSVYDTDFQKKWEGSCDEAEKMMIYKAAYKAFKVINITCITLFILTCAAGVLLDIGCLPTIVISIIWLATQSAYFIEAFRLEHGSDAK